MTGIVQGVVVQTTAWAPTSSGDRALDDLEADVDLGRDDLLIFDLGLGQRGLLDRRPHDRLGAAVELAALGELQQLLDDLRLGLELHREIGIVPFAHHAEALELLGLDRDPFLGIGAAFGAEFARRHRVLVELLLAILLLDLPLDRKAVAVPAGHVGRVLAEQGLGADHHVLEDLVHGVAHVDVAIGVRRAVVEDEALPPGARLAQAPVEAHLGPAREDGRLLRCEAGFHREVGLRKEDRVAVIGFFGHWRGISREGGEWEVSSSRRKPGPEPPIFVS